MSNFNYPKAYCVLAVPAFARLNAKQKNAHSKLIPLVGELQQDRALSIPISPAIIEILNALSCVELAEMSRASYFVGHWYPGHLPKIFPNSRGESWKIANCCDQILRQRLKPPHNVEIHDGKLRVIFSSHRCWVWEEFGLATEKNLEIFKKSNLPFGEDTLHDSVKQVAVMCGDLWPDVDTLPDNELYALFSVKTKEACLARIKIENQTKIKKLKEEIRAAKRELVGFQWFVEHGISLKNCIYYSHTGKFCFGWMTPLTDAEKSTLEKALTDCPYDYDFK